jgi:regulatory protein
MTELSEEFKKARQYAYLLLRFRARSVSEFKQKLAGHGYGDATIDQLTDDFKDRGLLDDAKFAKLWVQDRLHLKPMGKLKVRQELEAKGLDDVSIDAAWNEAAGDDSEYEAVKQLAQKRISQLKGVDALARKKRVYDFLKRRGFSYDVITKVIKEEL